MIVIVSHWGVSYSLRIKSERISQNTELAGYCAVVLISSHIVPGVPLKHRVCGLQTEHSTSSKGDMVHSLPVVSVPICTQPWVKYSRDGGFAESHRGEILSFLDRRHDSRSRFPSIRWRKVYLRRLRYCAVEFLFSELDTFSPQIPRLFENHTNNRVEHVAAVRRLLIASPAPQYRFHSNLSISRSSPILGMNICFFKAIISCRLTWMNSIKFLPDQCGCKV